jgi:flagellar biosynthetic protein FlhB
MSSGEDDGDKTEDPTDKKRTEAREKGNIAKSMEIITALMMLSTSLCLLILGPGIFNNLGLLMQRSLSGPVALNIQPTDVVQIYNNIMQSTGLMILPFMATMFCVGVLANVMQVGFNLTTENLEIKWDRISPMAGFGRIFSIQNLMKLGVSIAKLTLLVIIVTLFFTSHMGEWEGLPSSDPSIILWYTSWKTFLLAIYIALTLFIIAIIDYGFQWWKHEQDLKMTKQEVRDEMKNMEGDPHIKHKRKEAHRKLAQARELSAVKSADVVITNPTHISVALKYDPKRYPAPVVVAKGQEHMALRIRELARENNIPIIERKPLARKLYAEIKVGQPIPVDMYEVFVEIMAYVYKLSGKKPSDIGS